MIPIILLLIASFSFLLLIIGIVGKLGSDNKAYSTLILSSGVLFLILSLLILGEGIEVATGLVTTTINI